MDYKVGTITSVKITSGTITSKDFAHAVDRITDDYNKRFKTVDELMAENGFGILTDRH